MVSMKRASAKLREVLIKSVLGGNGFTLPASRGPEYLLLNSSIASRRAFWFAPETVDFINLLVVALFL